MPDVTLQIIDTTHFKLNQESDNIWISRMKCELATVNFYPLIKDITVNNANLSKDPSEDKQQHWRTATMINLV